MATIPDQCVYTCGPYRGYVGHAVYDDEAGHFHGDSLGLRGGFTFVGRTIEELRTAFVDSVEDYLAWCAERGEEPEKPYSGKFMIRIKPETHQRLTAKAVTAGKSLSEFVRECLEQAVEPKAKRPASVGIATATGKVLRRATRKSTRGSNAGTDVVRSKQAARNKVRKPSRD